MASLASRGYKTTVFITVASTQAASTDTAIGQLVSVGGPDASVEDIDVTNFDSTNRAREHLEGMIEGGEIKFTAVYAATAQAAIAGILTSTSTTKAILIQFEDLGHFHCQGYLNAYGIEPAADKDGVKGSFGWKVSGLPTFAAA